MTTTMTDQRFDHLDKQHTSLEQLIVASGHSAGDRIREFINLAAAAQAERFTMRESDTRQITRSIVLWTLMQQDCEIRKTLEKCGIDLRSLGNILSIRSIPEPT